MTSSSSSNEAAATQGAGAGEPTFLTIPEAYTELRISRWTLYQLIRSRQLRTVKIGRRRFVPAADLRSFIERLRAEETF
jgi:excisionase family DNA binding protein